MLPRGCVESAVESGVNLGNRGLMRYLPEVVEPGTPLHAAARPYTCDISEGYPQRRHENGIISAEMLS